MDHLGEKLALGVFVLLGLKPGRAYDRVRDKHSLIRFDYTDLLCLREPRLTLIKYNIFGHASNNPYYEMLFHAQKNTPFLRKGSHYVIIQETSCDTL